MKNMKRVTCLLAVSAACISLLGGCGSEGSTASKSASAEGKTYKVAMICDSSISDGGWGSSCYQAMVDAASEYGWETAYTDGIDTSEYAQSMIDYCELDYDLIFVPGNQYTDATKQVAEDYPDVDFALLNDSYQSDNITSMLPNAEQIGYMAGALAGLMTQTDYIGFIGGMELDTTITKLDCYTKAAQKVNPDVQVASAYAGSFSDTAKGMEIADSMITTYDVDVMFGDASAVDSGAREAFANYTDRFDIGQPSDLGSADDTVIACSVVTDNATLVKMCMEDVENDEFGNQTYYGDLSNGCLSVGTLSSIVPKDVQSEYLEIIEEIKNGTFIQ